MHFLNTKLNSLNKYFRTDISYFVKNGSWLGGSQVITALLSFASISIMGYYLTPETFGEYRYLLSLASIIGIFYLSGYATTITQNVTLGHLSFFKSAAQNVFYSSFAGSIIAIIMSSYYLYMGNINLGIGLVLIAVFTPYLNKFLLAPSYFAGKKEFKKISKLSLIPDITSTIFLILVSFYTNSVLMLLLTYFGTNFLGNLYIYQIIDKDLLNVKLDKFKISDLNLDSNSIHYSILNLISVVGINADKLLIFTMIGSKELAIFFFAQAIPLQARGLLRIIHSLAFPKFVEKKINFSTINIQIVLLLLFGFLGVATYVITAPLIFQVFFPKYQDAIFFTQPYSLSLITYPALYLLSGIVYAKNQTNSLYRITIYNNIFSIFFLFVGITLSGIYGLILASILNSVILFSSFYFYFLKIK